MGGWRAAFRNETCCWSRSCRRARSVTTRKLRKKRKGSLLTIWAKKMIKTNIRFTTTFVPAFRRWSRIRYISVTHELNLKFVASSVCIFWGGALRQSTFFYLLKSLVEIFLHSRYLLTLNQGWGTYGPHEHLIWPASEFSLPKLEYNIASKRSSTISRYLHSKSRWVTLPHS